MTVEEFKLRKQLDSSKPWTDIEIMQEDACKISCSTTSKIKSTYKSCIEFINWWNQN